jgi:hypothetical protein
MVLWSDTIEVLQESMFAYAHGMSSVVGGVQTLMVSRRSNLRHGAA